jgi:hypothetical protein
MSGARRDARPRAVTERIPVSAPPRAPHTAHGAHVLRISAPWRDCIGEIVCARGRGARGGKRGSPSTCLVCRVVISSQQERRRCEKGTYVHLLPARRSP